MALFFRRPVVLAVLVLVLAGAAAVGVYYWPETYLHAARAALARRDHAAARVALVRYLDARPQSAEAHLLLARLERRANNYPESLRHLHTCQTLGGPAEAIALERALIAIQNGIYTKELEDLCQHHLARQDENEYFILEALSQGFTKSYRLKDALICLQRMLVLQPDSNYALRRRAWICSQSGQVDQAEADYRRAVEIDPEDAVARQGLAQILLDIRKNAADAAEHFERLWAGKRDSTIALGLAQSWRALGRGEDARGLLDDWLTEHPRDALALMERGRLALDEHATEQAVAFLRQAVTAAPYLIDANHALYLCLSEQGLKEEAEECQVRIRQAKKDNEQLALLSKRLQATPDDPDLRCQMAKIFLRQREDEEGVRWLVTNLQNYPDHRPSHRALAEYYEKQGQAARAAEHRRQAGAGP